MKQLRAGRFLAYILLLQNGTFPLTAVANSPSPAPSAPAGPPATPIPRHVFLPNVALIADGKNGKQKFDGEKFRFGMICILATWNQKTAPVARFLNEKYDEFTRKKIEIIGVFSHDTAEALELWKKTEKPRFLVGLADESFIDALLNPKVPVCYVTDSKSKIVIFLENPTQKNLVSASESLALWTDF